MRRAHDENLVDHRLLERLGPFRTEFLGRSIATAKTEIDAYAETSGKLRHYRDMNNGRQADDPEKAAAVILKAVDAAAPPLHLPLGPIAYAIAEKKLASFKADLDSWRDTAIATDFS